MQEKLDREEMFIKPDVARRLEAIKDASYGELLGIAAETEGDIRVGAITPKDYADIEMALGDRLGWIPAGDPNRLSAEIEKFLKERNESIV